MGMLNALCWVAESGNGTTTQRVIDGEPMIKRDIGDSTSYHF